MNLRRGLDRYNVLHVSWKSIGLKTLSKRELPGQVFSVRLVSVDRSCLYRGVIKNGKKTLKRTSNDKFK